MEDLIAIAQEAIVNAVYHDRTWSRLQNQAPLTHLELYDVLRGKEEFDYLDDSSLDVLLDNTLDIMVNEDNLLRVPNEGTIDDSKCAYQPHPDVDTLFLESASPNHTYCLYCRTICNHVCTECKRMFTLFPLISTGQQTTIHMIPLNDKLRIEVVARELDKAIKKWILKKD
jgi:hypothetical protein